VLWQAESGQFALFGSAASLDVAVPPALQRPRSLAIPAAYARLAENDAYHRDESRLDAMYRVAYRIAHGEPALLQLVTDPDVLRLGTLSHQVARIPMPRAPGISTPFILTLARPAAPPPATTSWKRF